MAKTIKDLSAKINLFIDEVGTMEFTPEQAKIYAAFTKTKGRPISIRVSDPNNKIVSFKLDPTKRSDGPQHILLKHYNSRIGQVTALEIINMCEVIQMGKRDDSEASRLCYYLTKKENGVTYTLCLKLGKKDNYLKSFYSNRVF